MSVPPLVCSTPPPPDQCYDEVEDDEFSFGYRDPSLLSPSRLPVDQFVPEGFNDFDYSFVENCTLDNIDIKLTDISEKDKENISEKYSVPENVSEKDMTNHCNATAENEIPIVASSDGLKVSYDLEIAPITSEEDNNIEDLDLKLENLQIDFQNGKESVEDSLNATFDDFGTFLSSSNANDTAESSFYMPKIIDTQNCDVASDKESQSNETFSDASISIPNEESNEVEGATDMLDDLKHDNIEPSLEFNTTNLEDIDSINDVAENNDDKFSSIDSESPDATKQTETADKSANFWATDDLLSTQNTKTINENLDFIKATELQNGYDNENLFDTDFAEFKISSELQTTITSNFIPSAKDCRTLDEFNLFKESDNITNHQSKNDVSCDDFELLNSDDKIDDHSNDFDDFDDFATFQTSDTKEDFGISLNASISSTDQTNIQGNDGFKDDVNCIDSVNLSSSRCESKEIVQNDDDDDDFGDFDTYIPVAKPVQESALNFGELSSSIDLDAIEKLTAAVSNIFPEDIHNDNDLKNERFELKMILGENWTHLLNYETQQSYLFPWNNSTSQKSLLKCLGIDSRNILFGPKWNTNMPRFAANLGTNPLQPIRQNVSAIDAVDVKSNSANDVHASSSANKETEWDNGDPYGGTDFQASSYAESLLLDLEHLMATLDQMTSSQSAHFKISDLFTNACNERDEHHNISHAFENRNAEETSEPEKLSHPSLLNIGRKINLPDTHIFTPTDSETPWSHTIHYDDESGNKFSDSAVNNYRNVQANNDAPESGNNVIDNVDDFDDFQSFDDANMNKSADSCDAIKSNIFIAPSDSKILTKPSQDHVLESDICNAFNESKIVSEPVDDFGDFQSAEAKLNMIQSNEINVLEPVKVSPVAPRVNWPAPGDVNVSIFEDFSDIKDSLPVKPISMTPTSGPSSFILKESKIESEIEKSNHTLPTNSSKTVIVPSNLLDEFSDFQSVASPSYILKDNIIENQINVVPDIAFISSNTSELNKKNDLTNNINNDDFNDFQSAGFIPASIDAHKEIQNNEIQSNASNKNIVFEYKNDFLPKKSLTAIPSYSFEKPPLEPVPIVRRDDFVPKSSSQQILQPLSLENYSQINWPDPGIDLQDLTRFNPVNSIKSYGETKENSSKVANSSNIERNVEDDGWSDFVSIKPSNTQISSNKQTMPNMLSCNGYGVSNTAVSSTNDDSEDWSDFVSSTTVASRNVGELKTISQNIHTQGTMNNSNFGYKNTFPNHSNKPATQNNISSNLNSLPHLSYVSPKSNVNRNYNNHFQNL